MAVHDTNSAVDALDDEVIDHIAIEGDRVNVIVQCRHHFFANAHDRSDARLACRARPENRNETR